MKQIGSTQEVWVLIKAGYIVTEETLVYSMHVHMHMHTLNYSGTHCCNLIQVKYNEKQILFLL